MQGEVSGLNQIWSVQRQNCFSNTTRRQEGPSESHIGIHGTSLRSETPWVKSSSLSRDHPPELGSSHLDSGVGFSPAKAKTTSHNSLVCSEVAIKKKSAQVMALSPNLQHRFFCLPRSFPSGSQSWPFTQVVTL